MKASRVKEIASMGGKAAHAKGVAHQWDKEQAREAGRKGGQAYAAKRAVKKEVEGQIEHDYADHTS